MMMTVAQYAESRGLSVATVKNHIKKLELDLPLNPEDKRQRLISTEAQRLLDASTRRSPQGSNDTPIEVEVMPYRRSEETSMIIAEGAIVEAQLTTYQRPEENPLLQALRAQIVTLEQSNQQRYQQIQSGIQSQHDINQAISAAKKLQIVEAAQREAIEEFQMKQQLKQKTLTDLEILSLGLSPVNQVPDPTTQHSPKSQPSPSQPSWL